MTRTERAPLVLLIAALLQACGSGSERAPANRAPAARGDQVIAGAGKALVIAVLANDSDPDGDALTLESVSAPQHGTAVANPDGTVTYTATAGYRGADAFTYAISDGANHTAVGDVSVTVRLVVNTVVYETSVGSPLLVAAVPDGAGGAMVTWLEARSADISVRAQRTDATFARQWGPEGVLVSTIYGSTSGGFLLPILKAVPDGLGGVILVWSDYVKGAAPEIWAQRLDPDGTPHWPSGGVPVGSGAATWPVAAQEHLSVVGDGAGGAYVAWAGVTGPDTITGARILVQRLDASGARQWGAAGLEASTFGPDQVDPMLVPDGAGGVLVGWWQFGDATSIRAQRIGSDGAVAWNADGVPVPGAGYNPVMISDGAGGALLFTAAFTASGDDILGQRLDGTGAALWGDGGVTICGATGVQEYPIAAPDGAGGAVVTWWDHRGHAYDTSRAPASYAQRVTSDGVAAWAADGVAVSTISAPRIEGRAILADGLGGAVVAWSDDRDGASDLDVFSVRLTVDGAAAWPANGLYVSDAPGVQAALSAAPDASGGALIFFVDGSLPAPRVQISGQRVTVDGATP
jgi:hypothetical protein